LSMMDWSTEQYCATLVQQQQIQADPSSEIFSSIQ